MFFVRGYNGLSMRVIRLAWLLLLAALSVQIWAQDSSALPSAPSASLPQQTQKPAQAPADTASPEKQPDAKPEPPTLQSLGEPKLKPRQVSNADANAQAAQPDAQSAPKQTQSTPPTAQGELDTPETTIKTQVNEVNVVFTVTDKHNHFVKDLKEADFKVLDDKRPPEIVRGFSSQTNLPLRVGLLVDASNSIRDRFRFEQQAAIEFLNQIIHANRDQAFVLGFDTTPEITQNFTGDTEKLANGVRMLRPGGGTALYDALYGACRDKLQKENQGTRRAIILLSDGEDNQSRVTRDDAIEEAQRAEVIVYAISTNVSGVKSRGDKIMEAIATSTGGRAFFPFKIEEVSDAFSQIQEELRSQYAISYKPADFTADGRYRTIDIESTNKKFKVRSRKGYFAPKAERASAAGAQ
jgi:VWFA-related protein